MGEGLCWVSFWRRASVGLGWSGFSAGLMLRGINPLSSVFGLSGEGWILGWSLGSCDV